jgi:MscS family membrane protein
MDTRWLNCVLLLALLLALRLNAQLPAAPQTTTAAGAESSDDPLGRSTPRGTVVGFISAADGEDYERAVSYLDTKQQGNIARELVKQLQAVLNRETSIDLDKLSTKPEGNHLDTQNPNRELVGIAKTSTGGVPLWLQRVQRGNNPPIWLFSRDTLQRVPAAYEDIEIAPGIGRNLPRWLHAKLLSRPLWLWCIVFVSIPLVLILGSLFGRLLKPILNAVTNRFLGRTEIDSVQGLVGPLRLILFGILLLIGSEYAYTLLRRGFWTKLGAALIVFGATWLSVRVLGITSNVYLARLRRTRTTERIALAALLGRMFQITVFIVGALTVLYLAGVNLTAALAGLGIGGLALAFAAQKTLENLFGGIMIISDRPAHIGHSCKIGDITGTIVDIGLRSTRIRTLDRTIVTIPNGQLATMNLENFTLRDKYWFHPTILLAHETTVDQMETVLRKIRDLFEKHDHVESETARGRFVGVGSSSQNIEVSAYVFAPDYEEFLAIQEQLLLRILEIVKLAGTALALPLQRSYMVRDSIRSEHAQKAKTAAACDP